MTPRAPKTEVDIEVVSDFACPWCLVGKRRLEQALRKLEGVDARVRWSPFQLNPDMPREGRNRREYYHDKFGPDRYRDLRAHLDAAGADDGIVFCDAPDAVAPNTLSAHVLMHWATAADDVDENALAERLFRAHHVACENIGDPEVLVRIASESGLDADDVRARLAAREDEALVKERIVESAARGVTGVPFFVVDGRFAISGAQPVDVLAATLARISDGDA
jgi:predicted DsbA family dithiol-disulfide isomerase